MTLWRDFNCVLSARSTHQLPPRRHLVTWYPRNRLIPICGTVTESEGKIDLEVWMRLAVVVVRVFNYSNYRLARSSSACFSREKILQFKWKAIREIMQRKALLSIQRRATQFPVPQTNANLHNEMIVWFKVATCWPSSGTASTFDRMVMSQHSERLIHCLLLRCYSLDFKWIF